MVEKRQQDKYRKKSNLGKGASGQAYLVQSSITEQLWVIKKVDLNPMDYDSRIMAKREAKILEVLNHPNIIKFKDVFRDRKFFLNIVMEYADDGSLDEKILNMKRSGQHFSEEEILNYFT